MESKIVQVTAGHGPVECARVVAKVLELMLEEARQAGLEYKVLETRKGDMNGTLLSAAVKISGVQTDPFIASWQGTVQWIAQSPYRKMYRRRNWFVGVEVFLPAKETEWRESDVAFETCRASGPGGQNVNKLETAVRGLHRPSGIQVLAMDSRSQLQNRKLCLERLKAKVEAEYPRSLMRLQQSKWQEHNELERGNPVRTVRAAL